MKTEAALYTYLAAYSGLTALVSDRIFPVINELDADYPSIVYRRMGTGPEPAMGADADVRSVDITIVCLAETYSECKDVQEQIETALNRYTGTLGGAGGVPVQAVFLNNILDDFEDDMRVYVSYLEFTFWAEESI